MRQDIEASVIGGLLIGGLTPTASDVLATLEPEAFSIPLYRSLRGYSQAGEKQKPNRCADGCRGVRRGAFHVNPDDQQKLPECRKPEGICRNGRG